MKHTDTIPKKIHERRKKLRICLKCHNPLPQEETKQHCASCRQILKQNYQSKKDQCKELNVCFLCLKPLTPTEYFKCHKCYEKARINQIPYNDKLDRKSKAPKLCLGGCGASVDHFGKYCPTCKIESRKRNSKKAMDKIKQKKLQDGQNNQNIIKEIKSKPKTPKHKILQEVTLTEKEKQINTKNFYLQLEINHAIETKNFMGFNIKQIRKLKKLSVTNFAKIISLKFNELHNIESGKTKINLSQFVTIAKALEINPSMFEIKIDELYGKLFLQFRKKIVNIELLKLKENTTNEN